jgi:hypothetical protein
MHILCDDSTCHYEQHECDHKVFNVYHVYLNSWKKKKYMLCSSEYPLLVAPGPKRLSDKAGIIIVSSTANDHTHPFSMSGQAQAFIVARAQRLIIIIIPLLIASVVASPLNHLSTMGAPACNVQAFPGAIERK